MSKKNKHKDKNKNKEKNISVSNDDFSITVKNLDITYKSLKKFSVKKSLLKMKTSKKEEFEALKNVSFEVKKGTILGIIGQNGSGKSTLLKAIAGIFSADKGIIDLHGNSVSLLSIGVGFSPRLSGYENIFLSGMLLGFTQKEIEEHLEEIIEFSELEKFIDKPVRTYSSGMYSKLAFSITAILKTNIMLIDEVLSVGDAKFRDKSYKKMKELISEPDRTVLIVSHNLDSLIELCDEVIWLEKGELVKRGKPEEIIKEYTEFMK